MAETMGVATRPFGPTAPTGRLQLRTRPMEWQSIEMRKVRP